MWLTRLQIPPRWNVAEDTYWLPYYHRNVMDEFYGAIVNAQEPDHPLNANMTNQFAPFGAGLNGAMATHGASEEEYAAAMAIDTHKPTKLQNDGLTLFLLETECPLFVSDWALQAAQQNFKTKAKM
jgi:homogentisate 1,2-dioxygenase